MEYTNESLGELSTKASILNSSLFSKPVDEETIVNLLSETSNEERQIIRGFYKTLFSTNIQSDLNKSSLSKKLKTLCLDMFDTPPEYDARELYDSFHSLINDENTITEIFSSRPKKHFDNVDHAYEKFFGKSLRDELKEKKDDYSDYLLAIMDTERPVEQTITGSEAYSNAQLLHDTGLKKFGKNVDLFKNVFLEKSREDLILIARAFFENYNKDLYDEIEDGLSGKMKKLLGGILYAVITPGEWFANKIHKAIRGISIDEKELNRALISRSEIDMFAIRDYYLLIYNLDLSTDIENNISGNYGQVLVNLSQK